MKSIPLGQPCQGCARPLIRSKTAHVPEGHRRHYAHGLCHYCYNRLRGYRCDVKSNGVGVLNYRRSDEPDEIAVERAVHGDGPARLLSCEIAAAVRELDRLGLSAAAIARRLGIASRTVVRHRAKLRQVAAA